MYKLKSDSFKFEFDDYEVETFAGNARAILKKNLESLDCFNSNA